MAVWRIPRASEIESLAELASREQVRDALAQLAARHGKVGVVSWLPELATGDADDWQFIVEFERAQDAIAASSVWRCPLFGFTSVVVRVKGNGSGARSG